MTSIDLSRQLALLTGVGDNESFAWFISKGYGPKGWRQQWGGSNPARWVKPELLVSLAQVLERSVTARGGTRDDLLRALAGSVCASTDGAHATHPNYPERHEPGHHIALNGGPVLKQNANVRYATDAPGASSGACPSCRNGP